MEYNGYGGKITVNQDKLTITHSGAAAKIAGLADQPREIPLEGVSGVALKRASRLTNGWLSLGVGGAQAPTLSASSAASNADTVLFRHKDRDIFQQLHDWLLTVIAYNDAAGVDHSAVDIYPAPQNRTERLQQRAEASQEAAQESVDRRREQLQEAQAIAREKADRLTERLKESQEARKAKFERSQQDRAQAKAHRKEETSQAKAQRTQDRERQRTEGLMSGKERASGSESSAPAGWNAAPDRPGFYRWWDGVCWTDQYHPMAAETPVHSASASPDGGSSAEIPKTKTKTRTTTQKAVSPWAKATVWQQVVGESHYRRLPKVAPEEPREVVPGLVEVEVAVPRLMPAVG